MEYFWSIAVLVIYFAATLFVGLVAWRQFPASDSEGYVLGGRGLSSVVTLMTLMATQYSALTFSGFPAQFYRLGIGAFIGILGMYLFWAACWWMFFGARTWKIGRAFGHMTASDTVNHYWGGNAVGVIMAVVLFLALVPYVVTQIKGVAQIVEVATGGLVTANAAAILVYFITFIYVFLGGMKSVAYVDTLQGFILLIGIVGGALLLINTIGGGFTSAFQNMATKFPQRAVAGAPPWTWLFMWTWAVPVGLGWTTHPHMWLRMHIPKDVRTLRFWSLWAGLSFTLAAGGGFLLAVTGLQVMPGQEKIADQMVIKMLADHFPKIMLGLIAAAGLAAMMSSLSSQLHALGVSVVRDLVTKFNGRELGSKEEASYMRWAVFISATLGLFLAYTMESVLIQLGAYAAALGVVVLPAATAALGAWRWATKQGAIASMIGGTAALWITGNTFGAPKALANYMGVYAGGWGLATALVLLVVVSLLTPAGRASEERIQSYRTIGW